MTAAFNRFGLLDLVFDDDNLDALLYGEAAPEPTPAALFAREREVMKRVSAAFAACKLTDAVDLLASLGGSEFEMAESTGRDVLGYMRSLVPDIPCPVLTEDLRLLLPLLSRLEALFQQPGSEVPLHATRNILYRCHEHLGNYAEARRELQHLVDRARKEDSPAALARFMNNLGFEYFLEGSFREAAPYFRFAARISARLNNGMETANMRCNYWAARMESIGVEACRRAEPEIQRHCDLLRAIGDWRLRKALVLLARFEEARDAPARATALVLEAMATAKNSRTKWPEIDYAYLERLKRTRGATLEDWP